uniref:Uncharacterized protein n=1 Tax=Lygus hesperus TaxID=30085 RepID=A0A146L850_LYGHE
MSSTVRTKNRTILLTDYIVATPTFLCMYAQQVTNLSSKLGAGSTASYFATCVLIRSYTGDQVPHSSCNVGTFHNSLRCYQCWSVDSEIQAYACWYGCLEIEFSNTIFRGDSKYPCDSSPSGVNGKPHNS